MAQTAEIKASARPRSGKGAARAVRREGKVPAVIYGGDEKTAEGIALDYYDLLRLLVRGRFLSRVLTIDIDGKPIRAIPREVQLDPVNEKPMHVDFQRIGSDNRVRIGVPMRFVNEALSPGLKRGGVLNIVRREVEVWAPADRIPDYFEANLEGLEIGRSIHISAIKLPEGVRPTITDRDFTVATIAGAASMKPDVDEVVPGAAPAEGQAPAEGAAAAPAGGDAKGAAPAAGAKGAAAPAAGAKPAAGGKK
ncbi:MAG TPA: 50S ribosomal protein L25/general stress protein Ctc [Hyphomicrobiaceae bacterium]|jgi:large subunit ribosomal protein L25|nr:50S ribosomal protein L25/general stress protein Ctc [Hyphomicrobiaceae bacterium]